ncbi:MAG: aspartate--tRNA ligase [Candidatus Micrarchaeota archaeon]|nr:aspartate--tRNA ligase [Candidatus Micrarchaeota archaeon]
MEVNCGTINETHIGREFVLQGWCRYKRDHGGKLFIDIADRYGLTQLVFEGETLKKAEGVGKEYVIKVSGKVKKRDEDTVDRTNPTGKVELYVTAIEILNKSEVPPFEIIEEKRKFLANEEVRFKYRYLDLRRREMIRKVEFRDRVSKSARKFFWDEGFLELETPTLVKDTYETGSKTFLVPSRTNKGKFYALDQSPQIYKQLIMIGGLDKYFQMAKCYRDEDPREDRQPEHTQIDVEISFRDERQLQDTIEGMIKRVFKEVLGKELKVPFRRMKYADAIAEYGSDKPDLRFGSRIVDITETAKKSNYNILKRVISSNGHVKAIAFDADFGKKGSPIDKNYMLKMIETAKYLGLGGLTWLYVSGNRITSEPGSIAESLGTDVCREIMKKLDASEGNVIIICSDTTESLLLDAMGKLRKEIGRRIGKFGAEFEMLWVEDFPLFEKDEVTGKLKPAHNPFSAPTISTARLLDSAPEKVVSRQYDLVINGTEMGSGSMRINDPEMQIKVLKMIGMTDASIERAFGFLIDALRHGAPPECGIGFGLDRFLTVLYGEEDIKEFILFPKNKKYESPVDGSPTEIDKKRLKDDFDMRIEKGAT